jgi:hypothetical protein
VASAAVLGFEALAQASTFVSEPLQSRCSVLLLGAQADGLCSQTKKDFAAGIISPGYNVSLITSLYLLLPMPIRDAYAGAPADAAWATALMGQDYVASRVKRTRLMLGFSTTDCHRAKSRQGPSNLCSSTASHTSTRSAGESLRTISIGLT